MEILTKICTKCKTEKSTTEFNKCSSKKDGLYLYCKKCANEKAKIYRINNSEKIKQSKSKEYLKNKEKYNIRNKQDYYNNKEKYNKLSKLYYEENYNEILKQKKKYYDKNQITIKEKFKEYRKTDNFKISHKNTVHKRRTKFKDGDVTTEQLKQLYTNSKVCYWCNNKLVKNDIHLDHYVPIVKGGFHTISNLVLSCSKCNLTKGKKDPFVFANQIGKLF